MTPTELKTWRTTAGLSQPGLGRLLKVAPMTVSRWERGIRAIPSFLPWALKGLEASASTQDVARDSVTPSSE